MKKQQQIAILIAVVIVAGGAGYFAGTHGIARDFSPAGGTGAFQDMSPADRAARFAQTGGARGARTGGTGGVGGGFATGEVIGKDAQGITVKLMDGSSKIVLVASSTMVTKSSKASAGSITVGANVMINGSGNADGSITARMIDIRPAGIPDAPTNAGVR